MRKKTYTLLFCVLIFFAAHAGGRERSVLVDTLFYDPQAGCYHKTYTPSTLSTQNAPLPPPRTLRTAEATLRYLYPTLTCADMFPTFVQTRAPQSSIGTRSLSIRRKGVVPHMCIGCLSVYIPRLNRVLFSTATLISSDFVLAAAHIMKEAQYIAFHLLGETIPVQTIAMDSDYDSGHFPRDPFQGFALLKLSRSSSGVLPVPLGAVSLDDSAQSTFKVIGYIGNKDKEPCVTSVKQEFRNPNELNYSCDSGINAGLSGAGLLSRVNGAECLVGVHLEIRDNSDAKRGRGVPLTLSMIEKIQAWQHILAHDKPDLGSHTQTRSQ